MNRREMILRSSAAALALGLAGFPTFVRGADSRTKKVLFFSKSSGFEHPMIKRKNGEPSPAEVILAELGPKHGIDFTFSKDGSLFNPDYLAQFDAYFFYTTGILTAPGTDKNPPMSPEGKAAFLEAIENGKGFIGTHSAADTFHTNEGVEAPKDRTPRYHNNGDKSDPYIKMLGGEFISHGTQQPARMRVADSKFPAFKNIAGGFDMKEEWYSLKDFAKNLHILLVQETEGMTGLPYQRPPFPATWMRMHGNGRVFYTSMGHRDDVWASQIFRNTLFDGIAWAVRNIEADVTPNIEKVAPRCYELPAPPRPHKQ